MALVSVVGVVWLRLCVCGVVLVVQVAGVVQLAVRRLVVVLFSVRVDAKLKLLLNT